MACDMTYYRMNSGSIKYHPFVPRIGKNSSQFQLLSNQVENKLIAICRCACRNVKVISGGLNAA